MRFFSFFFDYLRLKSVPIICKVINDMKNINLNSMTPGMCFTGDLFLDDNFMLLPATAYVTEDLIKALKLWGYSNFSCDGGVSLEGEIITESNEESSASPEGETKIAANVKEVLENSKTTAIGNSDHARMEMVQKVYDEYMNYIENLFTRYTTHKEINQEELSETVQDLCVFIKDHRRYMLRINPEADVCKKNFLIIHTMRTTVLAIAIAMEMHLGLSKMIELGVSCILHEIGMLRLPPQLYMTDKKLTPGERLQITKHSIFGYTIVKDLNFPIQVQLGVLEHHEKENGTGYPQKKNGDKISQNAKIISVACSYEAISSKRSYKNERSTFEAIVELLQNKNHDYDVQIIKALLHTVSLYPIGSYVYLSNRKAALVIDVNPADPTCPVVQLLTEKDADGSNKIITTNQTDTKIARILTKSEQSDILELVDEVNKKNSAEVHTENPAASVKSETSPVNQQNVSEVENPQNHGSDGTEEVDINNFLV